MYDHAPCRGHAGGGAGGSTRLLLRMTCGGSAVSRGYRRHRRRDWVQQLTARCRRLSCSTNVCARAGVAFRFVVASVSVALSCNRLRPCLALLAFSSGAHDTLRVVVTREKAGGPAQHAKLVPNLHVQVSTSNQDETHNTRRFSSAKFLTQIRCTVHHDAIFAVGRLVCGWSVGAGYDGTGNACALAFLDFSI